MSFPTENQNLISLWCEDAALHLRRITQAHFDRFHEPNAWTHLPKQALSFLCRPGWPGSLLNEDARSHLLVELTRLAKPLFYERNKTSFSQFASSACKLTLSLVPETRRHTFFASRPQNVLTAQVTGAVHYELRHTRDGEEVIKNVAQRIVRENKRREQSLQVIDLPAEDPLRHVLSLPKNVSALPKLDVRSAMLRPPSTPYASKSLAELLRKAAPFASDVMQKALGEELFRVCKPLGFADLQGRIVLLEVYSSSSAHEVSFRKSEILHRLRKIEGLGQVRDLRFHVNPKRSS